MTLLKTPCIKICTPDPQTSLCLGCGRTKDEIWRWSVMSDTEREDVMSTLPGRLAQLRQRRVNESG